MICFLFVFCLFVCFSIYDPERTTLKNACTPPRDVVCVCVCVCVCLLVSVCELFCCYYFLCRLPAPLRSPCSTHGLEVAAPTAAVPALDFTAPFLATSLIHPFLTNHLTRGGVIILVATTLKGTKSLWIPYAITNTLHNPEALL